MRDAVRLDPKDFRLRAPDPAATRPRASVHRSGSALGVYAFVRDDHILNYARAAMLEAVERAGALEKPSFRLPGGARAVQKRRAGETGVRGHRRPGPGGRERGRERKVGRRDGWEEKKGVRRERVRWGGSAALCSFRRVEPR